MATAPTASVASVLSLTLSLPWWVLVPAIINLFAVVILVITDNREPSHAIAWLFVLILLPVVGLLFFFFFGRDWKIITARRKTTKDLMALVRTRMQPVYERNLKAALRFEREYSGTAAMDVFLTIRRLNGTEILPAKTLQIFTSGAEKFAHLKRDLAAAKRFINLEYFIWEYDKLTAEISEILHERLAAGVKVDIMYDYIGCLSYDKSELQLLAKAGATVSADMKSLTKLNYRNHRKIAVIDGEIGYTGGMNMGQEYIDGGDRFAVWRDTHLRITGQAVAELQKLFAMRWLEDVHEDLLGDAYLPAPCNDGCTGPLTQLVAHTVEDPWEAGRRAHMTAIASARYTLRIQSPYFVPDQAVFECLMNAALRGVDVQFMMTAKLDKRLPFWAAQTYYRPFLEAGGRIFLYEAGFLHSKTIVVDSSFGAVGTMNMDTRSLRLHKELMIWIYDPHKAVEMEKTFDDDLEDCFEITLADVESTPRPLRFRNSVARLFSAQI